MPSKLPSNSHPFFDPLWRRIVLVGLIAIWFLTELYIQSYTWAAMVGFFLAYGVWAYLVDYRPTNEADGSDAQK